MFDASDVKFCSRYTIENTAPRYESFPLNKNKPNITAGTSKTTAKTPPTLPRIDLEITTDGSWRPTDKLGGCAMAIERRDGRIVGKYWATRRDDDPTAVEFKGIRNALETLLAATVARDLDFTGDTRYVAIWIDCLDAVCELELGLLGESGSEVAKLIAIMRSNGRVTSVTHVEAVQAVLDARRALMARGVYAWVDWRPRMSYPEAVAADQWARAGASLAGKKVGVWNAAPDNVCPAPY